MNRSIRTCAKCFVPSCKNTTTNSRNKLFVHVREPLPKRWCQEANVEYKPGRRLLCCEDHLNLEEDLQNYQYYKLMNGRAILKPTAKLHLSKDLPSEPAVTKSTVLKSLLLLPDLSVQLHTVPESSAENRSTANIKPAASTHPVELEEDVINYKDWTENKTTRPRLKPRVPTNLRNIEPTEMQAAHKNRKSKRKMNDEDKWKIAQEKQREWHSKRREINKLNTDQNEFCREKEKLRKRKQRQKKIIVESHEIKEEKERHIIDEDNATTEAATNAEEFESDHELETAPKKSRFVIEIDYDDIDKFGEQIAFLLKRIPKKLCRELQDGIVTLVKTATNDYESITKTDVTSKKVKKQFKTPISRPELSPTVGRNTKRKRRKQLAIPKEENLTEEDIVDEATQLGTSINQSTSGIITFPKPIGLVGSLDCVKQEVLDPEYNDYETPAITYPIETDCIKIEIEEVDLVEEAKRRADEHTLL